MQKKSHEALIIQALKDGSQTIATAESCTGGLLAHRLTNISGASAVFKQGFITYSNLSKINLLHVSTKLLEIHGAVSQEAAKAMAEEVRQLSRTTFGLATTGIAGPAAPTGDSRNLPVGTLFLAIAEEGKETCVWREFIPRERLFFKEEAVQMLLQKFYLILKHHLRSS